MNLAKCSEEARRKEIRDDVKALSEKFGQEIIGFAYPYGVGAKQSREALRAAGVRYARLATARPDFRFPEDPLAMPLSCWHISGRTFERLDAFFRMEAEEDLFFIMFAHGYEFDFGTGKSNWDKFRRICEAVSGHDDVTACSIGEAFRRHQGDLK